jgi:putative hydrolase of the HAD superfamily
VSDSQTTGRRRIRCRAAFLDGGGVIVLPHRGLVAGALAGAGIEIDPAAVPAAHYRAIRRLEVARPSGAVPNGYLRALCEALGVGAGSLDAAVDALADVEDRRRSGEILWSEAAPHAREVIARLRGEGVSVVIVTNSDGHAAENLRDARVCQEGPGPGEEVAAIVDSTIIGHAKPDPEIFRVAMGRVGVEASAVVHVGDFVAADVEGAKRAGITPIHLDPPRACRSADHRHVRTLAGLWHHVAPA